MLPVHHATGQFLTHPVRHVAQPVHIIVLVVLPASPLGRDLGDIMVSLHHPGSDHLLQVGVVDGELCVVHLQHHGGGPLDLELAEGQGARLAVWRPDNLDPKLGLALVPQL